MIIAILFPSINEGGWGVVGAGLGLVWAWFAGVVGGQWDGEIQVTFRAGLLSHWPAPWRSCEAELGGYMGKCLAVSGAGLSGQWLVTGS